MKDSLMKKCLESISTQSPSALNCTPDHHLDPPPWFTSWNSTRMVAVETTEADKPKALLLPFLKKKHGKTINWTRSLRAGSYPYPTSQRAEITGIILALEKALETYDELCSNPYLTVTIYTDSRYAIGCMTKWIYKWANNGWINAAGNEVANRDLIEEASALDDRVADLGDVNYVWIPREKNVLADELCRDDIDEQCSVASSSSDSSYSSW